MKALATSVQQVWELHSFTKSLANLSFDVDDVIVDVVEEVVGLSVVEHSLETLKRCFEQRPNDALSHIKSIQELLEEASSHQLEASRQTTIDSFFRLVLLEESRKVSII